MGLQNCKLSCRIATFKVNFLNAFRFLTDCDAHMFANKSGLLRRVLSGAECGTRVVYYDLELNVITSSVTSPNWRKLEPDYIVRSD